MRIEWNDILHPITVLRHTEFAIRRRHRAIGRHFLEFMQQRRGPVNTDAIHAWLLDRLATHTVASTLEDLRRLGRLLKSPAVARWKARYVGRIRPTVESMRQEVQRDTPSVSGPLTQYIGPFLDYKESLRRGRRESQDVLARLDRWLQGRGIRSLEQLTHTVLSRFLSRNIRRSVRTSVVERRSVQQFCRWLRRTGRIQAEPEAGLQAYGRPARHRPYIYTLKQLAAVLERLRQRGGWVGLTSSTIVHLIYACGLRISEALKLGREDVDLAKRQLHIRFTKFGKSRTIPMGRRTADYLVAYDQARRQQFDTTERFFVTAKGHAIRSRWLQDKFRTACLETGLGVDGRWVRIHDLRHSFAVHRLYKWYADGHEPRAKLPLLSAYMGHVLVEYTAHYLQMGEDLMRIASKRCAVGLDDALAVWEESRE